MWCPRNNYCHERQAQHVTPLRGSLYVQFQTKCKGFFRGTNRWVRWEGRTAASSEAGTATASGDSRVFLQYPAGTHREGEETFVPGQDFFQGRTIVNDDIVITEVGPGKMPAVGAAVNQDLIAVALEFHFRLVYELLVVHRHKSIHNALKLTSLHL